MNDLMNKLKSRIGLIVLAVGIVIIAGGFYAYQQYRNTHISTDDAYVTGKIRTVASKCLDSQALLVKITSLLKRKISY